MIESVNDDDDGNGKSADLESACIHLKKSSAHC